MITKQNILTSVSEFNEFEPRLKSVKNIDKDRLRIRWKTTLGDFAYMSYLCLFIYLWLKTGFMERRRKSWKTKYNFKWNKPNLSHGLNLSRGSNSLKELSLCHKFSFCKTYIFAALWCKPLIFQTYIIWSNIIHSLKY